ncbi:LysE/ArgO family amino acid transporter [Cohnella candidum]|uniref:LysE family translocator n=1 Tax=Cohnella candidum TaxID=2674991 RepID=A0A3G3JV13_9BACL|nr:LysE family translocator [Cohnella candidum]AYQ72088.1 LysE family translocator [Cohnella candidum]
MTPWLQGIVLGLSIAAPVGPIGLLCIRTTLSHGRLLGFLSGLGAATADGLYGAIAALGLTVVTQFLVGRSGWIQLVGALFLLYLAYRTFRAPIVEDGETIRSGGGRGYAATYFTTLFLTLTNPMTIVSFLGIFAGLNVSGDTGSALELVTGVFSGSALWWLLLCGIVGMVRRVVSRTAMRWLNLLSGSVLLIYGLASLYRLIV